MSIEKPPERTAAGSNPLFAQLGNDLQQGQVRLFGDQCQNLRREFLQRRNASSARLRRGTFALVPALQPLDCRTHTDIEMFGRLTARCTLLNGFDHALPQIARIAPWHRLPPIGESMRKDSLILNLLGIPPIQIGWEPL